MSKMSDVRFGRQGGRIVPTKDGRSHLEHLRELRKQMGGSLKPEPDVVDQDDDDQLKLFDV